ncbi:MAG: hypothetical protein EXS11_05435 [Gemmataceae bacterium]|nr:hypothetical protein [Gemmataceae bacterium]
MRYLKLVFPPGSFSGGLGLGLLSLCFSGCFGGQKGGDMGAAPADLRDCNEMLRQAGATKGMVPAKVVDLVRFKDQYAMGFEAVKSGTVVVVWGAKFDGESEVGKNEVPVAYQKTVPESGGYVLLSAGSVKKMTAAEFKFAKK